MNTRRTGNQVSLRAIFSFLVVLAMMTVLLTGGATAEQPEVHTHEGWTAWDQSDAIPLKTGKYYLTTDITISTYAGGKWRIGSGQTVDLCLNGHSITFNFKEKGFDVYGGTLNLYDCGTEVHNYSIGSGNLAVIGEGDKSFTGGYITHTHGYVGPAVHLDGRGVFNMYGGTIIGNLNTNANRNFAGAVYVKEGSTFNLYDGVIAGNSSTEYGGGGIFAMGQFHMYGGEIRDNYANYGGGVRTVKNFTMSGGTIAGNTAGCAGGVHMSGGTMTLSGGSIADNTATEYSGAICNFGTLNMSGGSITGNTTGEDEGCIYNDTSAVMNISGGRITGNSSGDGGLCNFGTLKISGNPVISGNTDNNGNTMNVCLTAGKTITVTGELTSSASVGVTTKKAPEAGAPVIVGSSYGSYNDAAPDTVFFSDSDEYTISLKDKDAALVMKYTVRFDANGAEGTPPAAVSSAEGAEIKLPGQGEMTLARHAFSGWSREPGTSAAVEDLNGRETAGEPDVYAPGTMFAMDGNTTLYAQWEASRAAATVTWQDGDGSVLDRKEYDPDEAVPTTEKIPTKKPDEQYIYTFSGWGEPVTDDDGNLTYKPEFSTELQKYTVTFVNDDGSILKETVFEYGKIPAIQAAPEKPETAENIYTFAGWSDGTKTYAPGTDLPVVKRNVTYRAVYTAAARQTAEPTASPTAAPAITPAPTAAPEPTATPRPVPKTGDREDLILWTTLMTLCAGVLAVMLVLKPYRKKKD